MALQRRLYLYEVRKGFENFLWQLCLQRFPTLALLGDGDKKSRFQFSLFPEGYVNKNVLTDTGFLRMAKDGPLKCTHQKGKRFSCTHGH